jgi:hypothetical protein
MTPPNPDYPVRIEIDHPQELSRWLIFVKWLLAIPHFLVLVLLGIGAWFVLIISWFAVLITARYPEGLFNYMVGVHRWAIRVESYVFLQTDAYPPFSLEDDRSYPVRLQIDYPQRIARWRPLVSWLLVIPAAIGAWLLLIVAEFAAFFAWFVILFTKRYPQGLFDAVTIGFRWSVRTSVYAYWMTEQYPPVVWA